MVVQYASVIIAVPVKGVKEMEIDAVLYQLMISEFFVRNHISMKSYNRPSSSINRGQHPLYMGIAQASCSRPVTNQGIWKWIFQACKAIEFVVEKVKSNILLFLNIIINLKIHQTLKKICTAADWLHHGTRLRIGKC